MKFYFNGPVSEKSPNTILANTKSNRNIPVF
jgi:hypothetical protein